MSKVAMRYGDGITAKTASGLTLVASGEIDDETEVTLEFSSGGEYLFFSHEYNASSGAYRGHRMLLIYTPEESVFGTTAVTSGAAVGSSNFGITITNNDDSTVTIKRSAATYAVRYALYKVL